MVVVYEVAECPAVRKRAVEILDGYAVDGADGVAPLKKESQGRLEEDVRFKRGATRVDVLGGNGVWLRSPEDLDLLFYLLLIQLELHLQQIRTDKTTKPRKLVRATYERCVLFSPRHHYYWKGVI